MKYKVLLKTGVICDRYIEKAASRLERCRSRFKIRKEILKRKSIG